MAFIFTLPPFAAISARYRAAEMVLVLPPDHLQLKDARTLPITVGREAGSTTVEKIRGPITFGGGGLIHVLQLPTTALPRVRVGFRRPPSRSIVGRGLSSQMVAQILVRSGVLPPLQGQFDQQIDQVIVRVRPRLSLLRLSAVLPCPGRSLPHKPLMWHSRPIRRGVHRPHELFGLRHEL